MTPCELGFDVLEYRYVTCQSGGLLSRIGFMIWIVLPTTARRRRGIDITTPTCSENPQTPRTSLVEIIFDHFNPRLTRGTHTSAPLHLSLLRDELGK